MAVILTIVFIFLNLNALNAEYKSQCHKFYNTGVVCKNATDYPQAIRDRCEVCVGIGSTAVTVCNTSVSEQITIDLILRNVPIHIKELIVKYDNTWYGYLPLNPDPIDLSNIGRLTNLNYFEITDGEREYFQIYSTKINITAVQQLKKLTRLRIRISVSEYHEQPTIADMISNLPSLELLDLSYTRAIGKNSMIQILNNISHNIQQMCFRKFQLVGGFGYASEFKHILHSVTRTSYPNLKEFDLSDNTFVRIPPGITTWAPNLKALDVSGNMLLDTLNIAVLLEMTMHPTLEQLNFGYQGYENHNPNHPTLNQDNITAILNPVSKSDTREFKRELYHKQMGFLSHCMNIASKNNISEIVADNNEIILCEFMKKVLPSFFMDINCSSENFFPDATKFYDWNCMFFLRLPIGKNLKVLRFSHVHLEQSGINGIALNGTLCLGKDNSLQIISINGNWIWMQAAKVDNIYQGMDGIRGFDHLMSLSLNNNSIDNSEINIKTFHGILPAISNLDLSGNKLQLHKEGMQLCETIPNVEYVYLNNSGITRFSKYFFANCPKLKHICISNNKLNATNIDDLDFTNTTRLEYLDLRFTNLHYLNNKFIRESFPNLTIDFSENPLSCKCDAKYRKFTRWLKNERSRFVDYTHYYCNGPSGIVFVRNVNTETFWNECEIQSKTKTILISCLSTLGVTVMFAGLVGLLNIRWRLRYYIFTIQQWCNHACSRRRTMRQMWRYDAFISYCAGDRFWVHDTLMKTLENKYGFHLCIHYRDFPVSGGIAETVSERMSQSREIIIVLSDIALKSSWCNFELDEALLQTQRRDLRLIIIKLDKLTSQLLNPKLTHILDNNTFLEWSYNEKRHKLFWSSLVGRLYRYSLGGCMCCCPVGAKALGYKDIFDPRDDEDPVDETPSQISEPLLIAKKARSNFQQAIRFRETLEKAKEEDELPEWAFGPIPKPIQQLLKDKENDINDQVYKYANDRLNLLVEYLSELEEKEKHVYTTHMQKVIEQQVDNNCENENVLITMQNNAI